MHTIPVLPYYRSTTACYTNYRYAHSSFRLSLWPMESHVSTAFCAHTTGHTASTLDRRQPLVLLHPVYRSSRSCKWGYICRVERREREDATHRGAFMTACAAHEDLKTRRTYRLLPPGRSPGPPLPPHLTVQLTRRSTSSHAVARLHTQY
jgi:hypothetical protein